MASVGRMKIWIAAVGLVLGISVPALASDYAGQISAYRRGHGLSAVRADGQLAAAALRQAQAMASSGTISHSAAGSFSSRVAGLRKSRAAENIAAGFLTFAETLKQWQDSAGHRTNLLMPGARKVGVASVANARSPYRKFWAMVITD
ncbi:CAP domain-containing protein [Bradyrhizobium sp.]|uniref:CAP domain-containing protein n=1 Tax=Bradyrhizobium sp. TaxID=376 RepID=UPI002E18AF01